MELTWIDAMPSESIDVLINDNAAVCITAIGANNIRENFN